MSNILQEYLVKLGFQPDVPAFTKFQSMLDMAEKSVESHAGGMIKSFVKAQGAIVGGLMGVSAAVAWVADRVAMADQGYRLMGMRMLMTGESARKLDLITKGLGASLEEIVWDPELHRRAVMMSEDIDRMGASLGPDFEQKMLGIRNLRFEFSRLEVATKFLGMQFASRVFSKLFPDGDALEKVTRWIDRFQDQLPRIADTLANYAVPALKGTWQILLAMGEAAKAGGLAFTNIIGVLSGDTSIEGAEFSFAKLAKAIEHVENGVLKVIKAFTDAELAIAHASSAAANFFSGNTDAASKEAGKATEHLGLGSGLLLGAGGIYAAKKGVGLASKAAGPLRWLMGLLGGGEAVAGAAGAAEAAGAATAAGGAAAGGGLLAALWPILAGAGALAGANWGARKLFPQFAEGEDALLERMKSWFTGEPQAPEQETPAAAGAATKSDLAALIRDKADRYGVPRSLALAVAKQESGIRQDRQSGAGAIGVMQLMPGTARDLGVDPHDAEQNIDGGVRYLRRMLDRYHGDQQKALAAYNAGPGKVDHVRDLSELPRETRQYVPSVLAIQKQFERQEKAAEPEITDSRPPLMRRMPEPAGDVTAPRVAPTAFAPAPNPAAVAELNRPIAPPAQITNQHVTISMDLGGIHIMQPNADAHTIQRAVADGVGRALADQTRWDLTQLAPAFG